MNSVALGYLGLVALMSLFTFVVYGWDKRQARMEGQRVPEKKLHMLALLGGWPGAIAGRQVFRHKTRKTGFTLLTFAIVAVHVVVIAAYLFFTFSQTSSNVS